MEVAFFERLGSLQTFTNTQIGYKPALAYSEFDKFQLSVLALKLRAYVRVCVYVLIQAVLACCSINVINVAQSLCVIQQ